VVTGLEPKLNREPATYRCSLGDKVASSPQRNTPDATAYAKHSAATARHSLGVLRRVFDYAIRDGAIQRNPAAGIRLPKVQDNDRRPLTHDELWRLAGQFEGTRDRLLVLVAGYGGLRWGQADAASACVTGAVLGCDHDRMADGGLPGLDA
jgi:integrase